MLRVVYTAGTFFYLKNVIPLYIIILFSLLLPSSFALAVGYCANDTEVIDHLLYDTALNYNRHKLPNNPVEVRIELWIQEVTSVSELTQDFEIGKAIITI